MTKKQVYAKYGITFDGEKITLPDGKKCRELLKKGNTKTGEKVRTWSMLPGRSGTCPCDCTGCYAKTGMYNTPSVRASLELNTHLANDYLPFLENAIRAQLETMKPCEIRIHAAGDFKTNNPIAYAVMWYRIARDFPAFKFWTYTKMKQFESLFDNLENANIVKSIVPGYGFNFGHCDYILRVYEILKKAGENVYICRCGIDNNQHCENCGHCISAKYVLFIEHSTDYVAENDPAFPALKAIIDGQAE